MGRPMARHLAAAHTVSVTGRGGRERFADLLGAGAQ
jgi:3-hydroxyisobutyrate dehydrogenase-like beta-hydroxyacid dehydrogenase